MSRPRFRGPFPGATQHHCVSRWDCQHTIDSWPVAFRSAGHATLSSDYAATFNVRPPQFLMVLWTLAGRGRSTHHATDTILEPGTWFWSPLTPYALHTDTEPWVIRWVTFDGTAIHPWTAGWRPPAGPVHPACALDETLHDSLLHECSDDDPMQLWHTTQRAVALLVRATRPRFSGAERDLVNLIRADIQARYPDPEYSIEVVARRAGRHRSHLTRIFTRAFNLTPTAFLRKVRLRRAQELLMTQPELPIAVVARQIGFAGPDQFTRAFRRAFGCAPRSWRREQLNHW